MRVKILEIAFNFDTHQVGCIECLYDQLISQLPCSVIASSNWGWISGDGFQDFANQQVDDHSIPQMATEVV